MRNQTSIFTNPQNNFNCNIYKNNLNGKYVSNKQVFLENHIPYMLSK